VQHLSKEELLRLLGSARAHNERDWLAILVGFWHGLRVSEITSFTPAAVRDGYITIQRLKGSLKTVQPLVSHAEPLLNEKPALIAWVERAEPHKPVFDLSRQHFWRIMQIHCKTAGIPEHLAHPHILKHSIAMQTIKEAGIENVRTYLGHKSISSTGAYLKVDDDAASRAIAGATDAK
jgi:site-specific recombinase XerD